MTDFNIISAVLDLFEADTDFKEQVCIFFQGVGVTRGN